MIERYSDHASNERTMLAWVRTGIALIAFGFVLEKFHLFLRALHSPMSGVTPPTVSHDPQVGSVLLVVFGMVTMIGAILRYIKTSACIDDVKHHQYNSRPAIVASTVFIAIGALVLFYVIDLNN